MKHCIQYVLIAMATMAIIGYSSCVQDPQPNMGVAIPDSILANTWAVETFTVDTANLTEDFSEFTLEFLLSGQIVFRSNGTLVQLDPTFRTWEINIGNSLFISVDIPEEEEIDPRDPNFQRIRTLTQLSQIYVASSVTPERIDLFNRNRSLPIELVLVRP